jgi:hypothetical protein
MTQYACFAGLDLWKLQCKSAAGYKYLPLVLDTSISAVVHMEFLTFHVIFGWLQQMLKTS